MPSVFSFFSPVLCLSSFPKSQSKKTRRARIWKEGFQGRAQIADKNDLVDAACMEISE